MTVAPVLLQGRFFDNPSGHSVSAEDDFVTLKRRMDVMKLEQNRLSTYWNWLGRYPQRPEKLAEAGLFYTGIGDRVKCAFCLGVLKNWRPLDEPVTEHRKHFPHCRFIQGLDVGNIPYRQTDRTVVNIHFHGPLVNSVYHQTGKNVLDFTKETTRLGTFVGWPEHLSQKPNTLARAGFYHIPTEDRPDRVQCAYCHGKLYNWKQGDDPWLEHARCFPDCKYIQLCVGEDVLKDLQFQPFKGEWVERVQDPASITPSTSPEVDDEVIVFMGGDIAQSVLQMGFTINNVRDVVQRYHREKRLCFLTAEGLATELLGLEENENLGTTDVICDCYES